MRRLGALALAVLLGPAGSARADTFSSIEFESVKKPEPYHSPQHFAIELKFGPYSPNLDATPGLSGKPFAELFNNQYGTNVGKRPIAKVQGTIEFDWQILHKFGSLGLGGSVGFYRRYAHSFQYPIDPATGKPAVDPATGQNRYCTVGVDCVRSSDTTTLTVMPFALEVVYRFDVLALRYKFPIVPFLKGGIGYYLWWIERADGSLGKVLVDDKTGKVLPAPPTDGSSYSTDKAIGGTFGLVAHPGVALMLDVLDPSAARTLDSELGINHTYLFAELNYAWVTGFGAKSKMVFSDLTWNAGVAFEF